MAPLESSDATTEPPETPESTHATTESPETPEDLDDRLFTPGLFGRRSAISQAEALMQEALAELGLSNTENAKNKLVNALSVLQSGGWSIWEQPSQCSVAAEELLKTNASNSHDLINRYSSLITSERYVPMWKVADHLISRIASLLSDEDRQVVLENVLDHFRVMIGDATNEARDFRFLGDEGTTVDSSLKVFEFVCTLVDHPTWMRREKAAEVLLWLIGLKSSYFDHAARAAFEMSVGYAADVLCGVLDILSHDFPIETWERLRNTVDIDAVITSNRHISRLLTLHRISMRAHSAGSLAAGITKQQITSLIRSGDIQLASIEDVSLSKWTRCIRRQWKRIEECGIVTRELLGEINNELGALCSPFNVQDVCELEEAVSKSFRAPIGWPLNRWEAKVHFAFNRAVFRYVSLKELESVAAALCVFCPSVPCQSRDPDFEPPDLLSRISAGGSMDFSLAIGDSERYYLHCQEICEDEQGQMRDVEVLAVVVPSSLKRRGLFLPRIEAVFNATERPNLHDASLAHETCRHAIPELVFFGSFTAAYPLPEFAKLASVSDKEFTRITWKKNRSTDFQHFGRPRQEGCLLAVQRSAVSLPHNHKLAWLVKIDGELRAMIDAHGNELY